MEAYVVQEDFFFPLTGAIFVGLGNRFPLTQHLNFE